jgi:hypothetical protein
MSRKSQVGDRLKMKLFCSPLEILDFKEYVKLLLLLVLTAIAGCSDETESGLEGYKYKFVVEGWIEDGGYPYVILTHNAPFFTSLDSAQIDDLMIRWAKVTVSDGVNTEILTARKDDTYFPPYIYKGTDLIGKAGKQYTLKVEFAGNVLTAVTTIPKPVRLDSMWFSSKQDTSRQLNIRFSDNAAEKNYYRLYTKTAKEKRFVPTLLSCKDDKFFNGKQIDFQVNRGPENNLTTKNLPYVRQNEKMFVKISTIPVEGFKFWSTFQDEILNSSNPLIGSTGKIESNIQGAGIGIWCGYGSVVYEAVAK